MHFQIPILLAFSASLASTMALPNTSGSTLEKRKAGWVTSWANPTCSGEPNADSQIGKAPNDGGRCHPFEFVVGDSIGINFGSGLNGKIAGVTFYSDDKCSNVSSLNNYHTVVPGPSGMACITPAPGTVVNSISSVNYIPPV